MIDKNFKTAAISPATAMSELLDLAQERVGEAWVEAVNISHAILPINKYTYNLSMIILVEVDDAYRTVDLD